MKSAEQNRVTELARNTAYISGVYADSVRHAAGLFRRYLGGRSVLELGPAEGDMTKQLVTFCPDVTVVEGSPELCATLRRQFPGVSVIESLFEEFRPARRYDAIVMSHVLEHVDDPVAVLGLARGWLNDDGVVLASSPNCRSLHRQAAVLMGLLTVEHELNASDIRVGHRRVFSPETFREIFTRAGFAIEAFGGYWLKPLANAQIERDWTPEMVDGFMKLGERYPDIAAEIYVVARAATNNTRHGLPPA